VAAYEIDAICSAMEARLKSQISSVQIMDRLDDPSENPRMRAHLGVRVWPTSTDVLDEYVQNSLERVTDTIEVESRYELRRAGATGRSAALAFERAIRVALTSVTWYHALENGMEIRYTASEREKVEGWMLITTVFEVDHDQALGGD
jgi:hypothetical protein